MSDSAEEPLAERVLDAAALRGLAHPLRVEIYETLSVHGPATASGLADRLGESSGAMSYHLRQLEKHGFVRELEGRGTARERWWERVPGSVTVASRDFPERSAGRAASRLVGREFERARAQRLQAFVDQGEEALSADWAASTLLSTSNLRLTAREMAEVSDRIGRVLNDVAAQYRGRDEPGSRPVQLHVNLFPIVDEVLSEDGR
ncbi:MAG: helix-turn-helix domain-containing protein [Micrococcales bacterium]|nr:helix-turn-helix domain-containing protein [Micrococcales bacterium]